MSRVTKAYEELRDAVAESKLAHEFDNAPVAAVLAGSKEVIECIVQKASRDSGIRMDWGYVGGRAVIHALGDKDKARAALVWAMPTGLSLNDL